MKQRVQNPFWVVLPILIGCFLSSCSLETDVEPSLEFEPYIQKFEEEAAKRGRSIDISTLGLDISLTSSLPNGYVGQCRRSETPHKILILSDFWYSSPEHERERLFFHELGHCVLERPHQNILVPNKEYYSLMQGDGVQDDDFALRNRFINFTGFRRDFYLDELFEVVTSPPFWHDLQIDYDEVKTIDKENLFLDEFDDNRHNWPLDTNAVFSSFFEEGTYSYTSQDVSNYPIRNINLDQSRNFEIEIRMKDDNKGAVLTFGGNQPTNLNYFHYTTYYGRNGNGFQEDGYNYGYISRTFPTATYGTVYVWQAIPSLVTGDFVTLTVRRQGDYVYFFMNKEFFYVNDFTPFDGNLLGFVAAGGNGLTSPTTVTVDYLKVDYIP